MNQALAIEKDPPQVCAESAAFAEGETLGETIGRKGERADLLAYLARKRRNAVNIALKSPDHAETARCAIRQFDVLTDDILTGMHEGDAMVAPLVDDLPPGGDAIEPGADLPDWRELEETMPRGQGGGALALVASFCGLLGLVTGIVIGGVA